MLDGSGRQDDPGCTSLKIRRNVRLRHRSTEDILTLAINPVASAQVVVEDLLPDRLHIDVASARYSAGDCSVVPTYCGVSHARRFGSFQIDHSFTVG